VSWMIKTATKATKTLLHAAGFELTRFHPGDYEFGPTREARLNWLKNLNIRTVLDIGANTGQFAAYIRTILPEAMIYAFEPLKDCYQQLVETVNVPNFKAFNFALGSEFGEIEIHRSKYSPSSSILMMGRLHKEAFPFTSGGVVERIAVKRLDDIAGNLKFVENVLIKIDVQGFEDKVLAGGRNIIQKAKVLIVETSFKSLFEGQPLFDEIYDIVRGMGFEHHGNWTQLLNPLDGSVLQADGIFIKANK